MTFKRLSPLVLVFGTALSLSLSHPVHARTTPQTAADHAATSDRLEWRHGRLGIQITALSATVLRVRIGQNGALPENASWAVPADVRDKRISIRVFETPLDLGFNTSALRVSIARDSGGITITDAAGYSLLSDIHGPAMSAVDGHGFSMIKSIPEDAHYFGLGDKFGPLDRLGRSYAMWNTDSYGYSEGQDPLYKDIPFFMGLSQGRYYGLFLDNTWRTSFDFGHTVPSELRIEAPGGPIDYYVMAGPTPKDVEKQYASITGTPAPESRWMLGFQQSRWGYPTEARLRSVVQRLRKDRIPSDAIWMDVDYQEKFRPFTVDSKTFPNFSKMVSDFSAQHIQTIAITDLHIADAPSIGYTPYDTGIVQDRFVKTSVGKPYIAPVWPGPALFPEFTQTATRAWWGQLYKEFYVKNGVAGFWNDMDEPAIFETPTKTMPLDNVHRIDESGFQSRTASHAEIHNVYGMLNHRATYEGLLALKPDERPFVMTRASYAGGQRYGVTWTGDNLSSWNHLRLAVPMLESLGLSGFTFAGTDIGGFAGTASAELLTRWYELAMFTPIARSHADPHSRPQEPWGDGPEHEAIRRRFIEARYRLLPYNYSLAEEASRTGVPMMRPLFMEFPQAMGWGGPLDVSNGSEFMWGRSLLVAPATSPIDMGGYNVTLPPGAWFDFWTGRPVEGLRPVSQWGAGGSLIIGEEKPNTSHQTFVTPKLGEMPVYVRAGSIIPRQALVQSTDQKLTGPLLVDVYPGPDCEGSIYTDDGHSFAFQKGAYSRTKFTCQTTGTGTTVSWSLPEGKFHPWWTAYAFIVHGLRRAPVHAVMNEKTVHGNYSAMSQSYRIMVPTLDVSGTLTLLK
ncbi:glycoside hydrolase family 31 protein [Asaia bogorensis]|uniref:glycoside hydrolase family 31 protein n=2 Tax=Acetobacteraceae TaxID=433 RepID=UPI00301B4636